MSTAADRPIDLRDGSAHEVAFFDDPLEWLVVVLLTHPAAIVEADARGVLRALVEDVKVGNFGKLRGFGSVLTPSFARDGARPHRPHRLRNLSPAERRARELDRYQAKKRAAAARAIDRAPAGGPLVLDTTSLHHETAPPQAAPISSGSRATETPSAFTAPP